MRKLRNTIIVLFVLILIALAVIIYAVPSVTGMLVETYPAEYGELSIYDDTVGYFLRTETVYASESGGSINRLSSEGDLLRPNTTVLEITGGSSAVSTESGTGNLEGESTDNSEGAPTVDRETEIKNKLGSRMKLTSDNRIDTGGIVSFFVDGYEYTLVPDRSSGIKKSELDDVLQSDVKEIDGTVRSGYPTFKIISNDGWQLIAYIPKEHINQYDEGRSVDVTFFERDEAKDRDKEFVDLSERDPLYNKVEMIVKSVETEGDYGKLILRSSRFFGGIGKYRVACCRIVSQDVSGLLIENESITQEDGVTGVYVKNKKGKYDFVPVEIYGGNEDVTVIADTYYYDANGEYTRTVDPFDDVLRKPRNSGQEKDD